MPQSFSRWPLGTCVFASPPLNRPRTVTYPSYVGEILSHAGVCHTRIEPRQLRQRIDSLALLLTVGESAFDEETKRRVIQWLQDGGAWISIGGTCGMEDVLGVERLSRSYNTFGGGATSLGEGFLVPRDAEHPTLDHLSRPLHFFEGAALKATTATILADSLDAHGRTVDRPVLFERKVGKGRCILIGVDLTGTVVRIQQGTAVTRDGISAPDGTAPVADGVLKTGDGGALDWLLDREPVPGTPGFNAYLQPIADQWREILLRSIFHVASKQQVAVPVLWLYPRRMPAIAHMSHDTDGNEPEKARRLLEVLQQADIRTTWCTIMPGYGKEMTSQIRQAGHELAMHYDAMTEGLPWSEELFDQQWKFLIDLFGGEKPVSNKNHYLRWEGDCEFFTWCEKRSIKLDQSKGASKTGEAGFNFGTCHPYFPVGFDGQSFDVLEFPTPTQDLHVFAPEELTEQLVLAAERHHGVLHLLYHPAHIMTANVADSIIRAADRARRAGMEWWTAARINQWERARRGVQWLSCDSGEDQAASVTFKTQDPLEDATLLWLSPKGNGDASVDDAPSDHATVTFWGFRFASTTVSLSGNTQYTLRLKA